jgi:hypothetical protein
VNITCALFLSGPRNLWIRTKSDILLLTGTFFIGNWSGFKSRRKLMPGLKEKKKLPPKTHWVTYGLQGLSTEKFLEVVQKIIEGKYTLLKPSKIEPEDRETDKEFINQKLTIR